MIESLNTKIIIKMKLLFSVLIITGFTFISALDYPSLFEKYKVKYKDSHLSSKFSLEAFTMNMKNIQYHNSNN